MKEISIQLDRRHCVCKCEAGEGYYRVGDLVMVDTEEGSQVGRVVQTSRENLPGLEKRSLPKVLRTATEADLKALEEQRKRIAEALRICKQKVEQLDLPMKLVDAQFQPDGEKITFFFVAETRINFRDLVKQLAGEFHTRIEMRQIGARNEAKAKGGIGCCGRQLCCACFLPDFVPVTIRMAKDQGLPLDPTKISGLCGRLLCCLAYEAQTYSGLKENLPKAGSRVIIPAGEGKVVKQNIINQTVVVELEDRRQVVVNANEVQKKTP